MASNGRAHEAGANVGPGDSQGSNDASSIQFTGYPKFRRLRASRACEMCRIRKIRCDAATIRVPCTNCSAFRITCIIKLSKQGQITVSEKENGPDRYKSSSIFWVATDGTISPRERVEERFAPKDSPVAQNGRHTTFHSPNNVSTATTPVEAQYNQPRDYSSTYAQFKVPNFTRAPIKMAGRVAHLGESLSLNLIVDSVDGTEDTVHYRLPEKPQSSRSRLAQLDSVEINILHLRGAFSLPPKALCDELVESYFKWVAPAVPVINRTQFMKQYRSEENHPSLLLLQAILLAGSRVCTHPQLVSVDGSTIAAARIFYTRAKALYDANYEDDRITIVQALILMGWYGEGLEDETRDAFYWTRVATVVAQSSGMHRNVKWSQLGIADKRIWKRIWWTLFTRDRSVAVTLGSTLLINADDCDVEMVCEEDFIEDGDPDNKVGQDPLHVKFFLQHVKLCEIMGLILLQQYSVSSKTRSESAISFTHSIMALTDWLQNCPADVYWELPRHHFWSAVLHSNYYTMLFVLRRIYMPPVSGGDTGENWCSLQNIDLQPAVKITSIANALATHNELRYCPAFMVYSLFSALIMHEHQMQSNVASEVQAAQGQMRICINAVKDISRIWLTAKMVYTLFESAVSNTIPQEGTKNTPGKRHKKIKRGIDQEASHNSLEGLGNRKYGETEYEFNGHIGPPSQELYGTSRVQASTRDLPQYTTSGATPPISAHDTRQSQQTLMSAKISCPQGIDATSSFSILAAPPDMYTVMQHIPRLSQSIFQQNLPLLEGLMNTKPTQFSHLKSIANPYPKSTPSKASWPI